jgi:hypothetical protein
MSDVPSQYLFHWFYQLIVVKLGKMLPETVINIATTVNKYQTARNSGQTTTLKIQKNHRLYSKKIISNTFVYRSSDAQLLKAKKGTNYNI